MTHLAFNETAIRDLIRREFPALAREDRGIHDLVIELGREQFADRDQIEGRIDRMLDELRRDREENARKWDEHTRKWDKQQAKGKQKWEENNRKWDKQHAESKRQREEDTRKWDEQRAEDKRKWDENNRRWEEYIRENREEFKRQHEEIMAVNSRIDRTISALGARWGFNTERSFRDALAAILERASG